MAGGDREKEIAAILAALDYLKERVQRLGGGKS